MMKEISDLVETDEIEQPDNKPYEITAEERQRQIHQAVVHTERRDYSPTPRDDIRQRINASIGASEPDRHYD